MAAATDPRTLLEIVDVPSELAQTTLQQFEERVLHWVAPCLVYNRAFDTEEQVVLIGDRRVYCVDVAGRVTRCYDIAHVGGVTLTEQSDGQYGVLIEVDVEQAPPATPNLLFAVPGGASERARVEKILTTLYAEHVDKDGLNVDTAVINPTSTLLATLKVPRRYEVEYAPPMLRAELGRFEYRRPAKTVKSTARTAVFSRPGAAAAAAAPAPTPANDRSAGSRRVPSSPHAAGPTTRTKTTHGSKHSGSPTTTTSGGGGGGGGSRKAAPASPANSTLSAPDAPSRMKSPSSPLTLSTGNLSCASSLGASATHLRPTYAPVARSTDRSRSCTMEIGGATAAFVSAPVPAVRRVGSSSALNAANTAALSEKLSQYERYERDMQVYLQRVFETFPSARGIVGNPPMVGGNDRDGEGGYDGAAGTFARTASPAPPTRIGVASPHAHTGRARSGSEVGAGGCSVTPPPRAAAAATRPRLGATKPPRITGVSRP